MNNLLVECLERFCEEYAQGNVAELTVDEARVLGAEGIFLEPYTKITDQVYDSIYSQLESMYEGDAFFNKVNKSDAGEGQLEKHDIPAGGLIQVDSIRSWADKFEPETDVIITQKLDGCSLVCTYEDGKLVKVLSRGNGVEGFNITHKFKDSRVIRQEIDNKKTVTVRGELIISKNKWEELKDRGLSNARNTVAGFINAKQADESLLDYMDFVAYSLYVDSQNAQFVKSKLWALTYLVNMGFNVPEYIPNKIKELTDELLISYNKSVQEDSDYECDGIVLDLDLVPEQYQGQEGTGLSPKYARKYKKGAMDKEFITKVKSVSWHLGAYNRLTPVVHIEPVEMYGAVVTQCTGVHYEYIAKMGLYKGQEVVVRRSGGVIPQLLRPVDILDIPATLAPDLMPEVPCHIEGIHLIADDSEEVRVSRAIGNTVYFLTGCKVLGVGRAWVKQLFEYKGLKNIDDIFSCSREDWVKAIGVNGGKIYDQLWDYLNNKITEVQWVAYGNVFGDGFGLARIQQVYDTYGTTDVFDEEKLSKIPRFNGVWKKRYMAGLLEYTEWMHIAKELGIQFHNPVKVEPVGNKYANVVACFTGVRDKDLVELIKQQGGQAGDTFTKAVTVLIAKDPEGTSTKITKARQLGIEVISLEEAKRRFTND